MRNPQKTEANATAGEERLILAHAVWMERYAGDVDTIRPSAFNWKNANHRQEDSNERLNFQDDGGVCRGFIARLYTDAQSVHQAKRIDIGKLGAGPGVMSVSGVTVVWTAKHPDAENRVVVGWYSGATVFRILQTRPNNLLGYYFEAPTGQCRLLRPEERIFEIPLARDTKDGEGPGHDPLYYADINAPHLTARLRRYIARKAPSVPTVPPTAIPPLGGGSGRQADPVKRLAVEKAAMELVMATLKDDWVVSDDSLKKLGWDITAKQRGLPELRIEVKGLSGQTPTVEVTPREYAAMCTKDMRRKEIRYIVAIVTDALSPAERLLRAYAWNGVWRRFDLAMATFVSGASDGLIITERPGARISIVDGVVG